jgi:hypothetical protein
MFGWLVCCALRSQIFVGGARAWALRFVLWLKKLGTQLRSVEFVWLVSVWLVSV